MKLKVIARSLFLILIFSTVLISMIGGLVFWYFSSDLPELATLQDYKPSIVSKVVAQTDQGELLGEFSRERRIITPSDQIPELVVNAFIAAEDDQFFKHQGVNFASIMRAAIANFRAGHVVQGGSTITQQVAKSLLLTSEKTFTRKVKEVLLASQMEHHLDKKQILYLYLNQIYLGNGAYGVGAAAQAYFGKSVSDITLAEAAILAGMPQAPSTYNPFQNPGKAKERQKYVLRRMQENGFISSAQLEAAVEESIKLYSRKDPNLKWAPYYIEHIRRYLIEKYGEELTYGGGMTVVVPTSRTLSQAAQKSVEQGLREVDKRLGYRGPIKRLKKEQVDNFIQQNEVELLKQKFGYTILSPDGKLNVRRVKEFEKVASAADLLPEDELVELVIEQVDTKKGGVLVRVGSYVSEIAFEQLKWAVPGQMISQISRAFTKGDVVRARFKDKVLYLEQKPELQGALLSLDSRNGNVLAMVGGYDFEESQFNRAIQAERQPGSAFKPFIFAAAIEKGYTPVSLIMDSPLVFTDEEFGKWKPSNFDEKFYGDTTLRSALIKSRNIPTIRILQAVGLGDLFNFIDRIDFKIKIPRDFSISLGSGSVSLLEITKTYAVYPRLGKKLKPVFFTKILDRDGKILEENTVQAFQPLLRAPPVPVEEVAETAPTEAAEANTPPAQEKPVQPGSQIIGKSKLVLPQYPLANDPEQVMDPRVASLMTQLMNEVVNYGTGRGARGLGKATAGKTGTTNDYMDAWFMGYTPEVVTGTWVGYDGQKTIGPGETGSQAALPIWFEYMKVAVQNYQVTEFPIPDGIVYVSVNSVTGKKSSPNTPNALKEAFIEGTEPKEDEQSQAKKDSPTNLLKEDF